MRIIKNKISCIIPSYRGAQFLPLAVSSFLSQSYKHKEAVIIVQKDFEDHSYDDIIKLYQTVPNLKILVFEQSFFPSRARNIGIKESSGEFICILDDDDSLGDPYFFSTALKSFNKNNDIWIISPKSVSSLNKNLFYRSWGVMRLDRFNFSHSGSIIRRLFFEKINMYNEKYRFYEDLDLFLRILRISRIVTSDSHVFKNIRSSSFSYSQSSLEEFICWFRVVRPYIFEYPGFLWWLIKKSIKILIPRRLQLFLLSFVVNF